MIVVIDKTVAGSQSIAIGIVTEGEKRGEDGAVFSNFDTFKVNWGYGESFVDAGIGFEEGFPGGCLLYTSPSPRDRG